MNASRHFLHGRDARATVAWPSPAMILHARLTPLSSRARRPCYGPPADPRPVLQTSSLRVAERVLDDMLQVGHASDEVIRVLRLPDSAASAHYSVDPPGRKRLPAVQHRFETMQSPRLNDRMHVVRHDAPGQQRMAIAVEVRQRPRHDLGHLGSGHPAGPAPCVEVSIHLLRQQSLDPSELPRSNPALSIPCPFEKFGALLLETNHDVSRKRVAQPERHEVGCPLLRPVRQVSPVALLDGPVRIHAHAPRSATKLAVAVAWPSPAMILHPRLTPLTTRARRPCHRSAAISAVRTSRLLPGISYCDSRIGSSWGRCSTSHRRPHGRLSNPCPVETRPESRGLSETGHPSARLSR